MYVMYLDGVAFPIPPEKCEVKVNGKNKTVELASGVEINILNAPGLSDVNISITLPGVPQTYAYYPSGFRKPKYYLDKLERLALAANPFRFILNRALPDGTPLHATNMSVSIEDYTITDSAGEGFDTVVKISLRQFVHYETGLAEVRENPDGTLIAVPRTTRPASQGVAATYTVKAGDTLCNIAKKFLGNDALYTTLAIQNGISNPCKLAVGMVIRLGS